MNKAEGYNILTIHLSRDQTVPIDLFDKVDLLMNTASGSNLDEGMLIDAIQKKRVKAAIIDTFTKEGEQFDNCLFSKYTEDERIIMTPHIAYLEKKAIYKTVDIAIKNLHDAISL